MHDGPCRPYRPARRGRPGRRGRGVAAGVAHDVLRYHHDPRSVSFGDEAVAELADAGVQANFLAYDEMTTARRIRANAYLSEN